MIGREVNAAIPVTLFLLISVTLYGFYDNLSGVDEGSDLVLFIVEKMSLHFMENISMPILLWGKSGL